MVDFKILEGYRGKLFVFDPKTGKYRFMFAGPAVVGVKIAKLIGQPYRFEVA